ncbi:MAG: KpsF/GutQ family sugar-phosphate isomerase, partial [Methylobacteriaceae bacterium]|nr:KpsF/GutQ family sugar-phosphate isomerase [Methylobacteriaceae bacterium]
MSALRQTTPFDPAIGSALRTLEAERDGLAVLRDAMTGPLGRAFADAVELVAAAKGRAI